MVCVANTHLETKLSLPKSVILFCHTWYVSYLVARCPMGYLHHACLYWIGDDTQTVLVDGGNRMAE